MSAKAILIYHLREKMMPILIQILRWLMQEKVWRFVGFASAIVGLVCYALSSSFNYLFGEWNLSKIILYSVISFIICLMILYPKVWQSSRGLKFKAHTAFFVLTLTSVYSFIYDKVVNEKPDAYSLISCAAFAIMSLSLSRQTERQTQCGFEVDLLYFFLGCLIVQLMKVKLQLAVVGVGFSYFVIIFRSAFSSSAARNGYAGLPSENSLENPNLMDMILELVKKYREEKTRRIFIQWKLLEPNHAIMTDPIPSGKINDIREIAKLMVGARVEEEFTNKYISNRRGFLQELLINKLLGLQDINIDDDNVKYAETMAKNWSIAFDAALCILFPIEQRLCDLVFSGISSTAARCFTDICEEAICQMLNFALAVTDGRPSAWRLLNIIEIYRSLSHFGPKYQSWFPDSLVTKVIATLKRLGETSRDLFMELDNLTFYVPIAKQVSPAYGLYHPITDHVTDYLDSIHCSQKMLEEILSKYPKVVASEVTTSCSFTAQIKRMIALLETELIAKSKNYKYPAMQHLFMMNNRKRIEQMLNKIHWNSSFYIGDDWFPENQAKIQQHIELYHRNSWSKVIRFLKVDSNELGVTQESLIDKLNLFNIHFEEICSEQSMWLVYDKELRKEVIESVENTLLPAYGIFMGKFQDFLGNHAYKYIEYGLFEIQDRLSHLFLVNSKDDSFVSGGLL
ncbi:putative exocyst complex component Exo70, cullin repeat-like-containing domain-containing protein [Medicago truncatula]|uniref:Exocyst subunit Exo70 family protein n=1 Tax=Medicago truncatula TaxID=3880 RepID=A0A396IPP9_MEDTR|nr:putative exocyst complex component Exo70, cullin repeat-like-containing domain-containing protein [Medicago truncatula]